MSDENGPSSQNSGPMLLILAMTSDETIVADNRLSIVFGFPIIDFIFHNRLSPRKKKNYLFI
jgi:hypothetical protein